MVVDGGSTIASPLIFKMDLIESYAVYFMSFSKCSRFSTLLLLFQFYGAEQMLSIIDVQK